MHFLRPFLPKVLQGPSPKLKSMPDDEPVLVYPLNPTIPPCSPGVSISLSISLPLLSTLNRRPIDRLLRQCHQQRRSRRRQRRWRRRGSESRLACRSVLTAYRSSALFMFIDPHTNINLPALVLPNPLSFHILVGRSENLQSV